MSLPPFAYCVEVAARGIAFTRSFARPYTAQKIKGAWWLHDDGAFGGQQRNDEWFAPIVVDPERLDGWARERAAKRFLICAVAKDHDEQAELLTTYRNLGYRLWRTEPLMVRSTTNEPSSGIGADIQLVDTEAMAAELAKISGGRMILPEHLAGSPGPVRCHIAKVKNQIVGWVRSISIGQSSWCASLFVEPEFRRRGIGRCLVTTMLRADRTAGSLDSILIASHTGAKLYSAIGYHTIGTVLVLNPPRA